MSTLAINLSKTQTQSHLHNSHVETDKLNLDLMRYRFNVVQWQTNATPISHHSQLSVKKILKTEDFYVLDMKIQGDIRWNLHIFQISKEELKWLCFLKRYIWYPYYLHQLCPTRKWNSTLIYGSMSRSRLHTEEDESVH